jgi:hypothetical protein
LKGVSDFLSALYIFTFCLHCTFLLSVRTVHFYFLSALYIFTFCPHCTFLLSVRTVHLYFLSALYICTFCPHCTFLLSDLGEIQYKKSAYDIVENFEFLEYCHRRGRPVFMGVTKLRLRFILKRYNILTVKNALVRLCATSRTAILF